MINDLTVFFADNTFLCSMGIFGLALAISAVMGARSVEEQPNSQG